MLIPDDKNLTSNQSDKFCLHIARDNVRVLLCFQDGEPALNAELHVQDLFGNLLAFHFSSDKS